MQSKIHDSDIDAMNAVHGDVHADEHHAVCCVWQVTMLINTHMSNICIHVVLFVHVAVCIYICTYIFFYLVMMRQY